VLYSFAWPNRTSVSVAACQLPLCCFPALPRCVVPTASCQLPVSATPPRDAYSASSPLCLRSISHYVSIKRSPRIASSPSTFIADPAARAPFVVIRPRHTFRGSAKLGDVSRHIRHANQLLIHMAAVFPSITFCLCNEWSACLSRLDFPRFQLNSTPSCLRPRDHLPLRLRAVHSPATRLLHPVYPPMRGRSSLPPEPPTTTLILTKMKASL
jgi:hypothetical protein